MGVISDLLANAKTFDAGGLDGIRDTSSRITVRKLTGVINSYGDRSYPSGIAGANEVQQITANTADDGTYTLTFNLYDEAPFTTDDIAFDANAATIQGAINTAAAGVTGWTDGDIAVTGGPLSTTTTVFTFSGTSVASKNHGQTTIDGADLLDGSDPGTTGTASTTTQGQSARTAWGTLMALGIISSAPPVQFAPVTSVTAVFTRGTFPFTIDDDTVLALIDEACYQDGGEPTVKSQLKTAFGF